MYRVNHERGRERAKKRERGEGEGKSVFVNFIDVLLKTCRYMYKVNHGPVNTLSKLEVIIQYSAARGLVHASTC